MKQRIIWIFFYILVSFGIISSVCVGSDVVTAISENLPIERSHIIVIDAGHGGEDGGTASMDGVPESAYNLSISLRLEKMMHLLGMETFMIRNQDMSVYTSGTTLAQKKRSDLKERVRLVNETDRSILLSIHQNNFPDEKYRGAQVFYAETEGSKPLARDLQTSIRCNLDPHNSREIKPARGIYLMEHVKHPGVLIECGFLSNYQEAQLLRTKEYQKKLACVIAVTVKEHLTATQKSNA